MREIGGRDATIPVSSRKDCPNVFVEVVVGTMTSLEGDKFDDPLWLFPVPSTLLSRSVGLI